VKTIRLLTIGNSFSENALTYLERIAEGTDSVRFDVGRASLGGCSLERHWNLSRYTERRPEYKTYRLGTGADGQPVSANLQDALAAKPWDFVTLQQVSARSWRCETFEPWLGLLHRMIRTAVPGAAVMLHQTWAYRSDTAFFAENAITQEIMHRRIRETYLHYAEKYTCGVLPSGEAIHRARTAPGRTFQWPDPVFDYQQAEAPALPRQDHSLAVGWYWLINQTENGIPALRVDPNHLNARGCYLCSAVWFETLSGLRVHDSRYAPEDIEADDAAFLRDMAHATVSAGRDTPG